MRYFIRPQRPEWWLNPIVIVCLFHIPLAIAAALTPDSSYQILWQVPKYFFSDALTLTLATSLLLILGCFLGMLSNHPKGMDARQTLGSSELKMLDMMFRTALVLTVLGYLTFGVAAYARGASIGLFLDLIKGQAGASSDLKKNFFKTLPGITTCTQFGIGTGVLGVVLARFKGWKSYRLPLVILFVFSIGRAILLSERLALIEVLLPAAVISFRLFTLELYRKVWRKQALRTLPLFAPFLLYFFFALSESVRSWTYYSSHSASSLWEFAFGRLSGYYLTSMNNSAYLVKAWHYNSWIPFYTLDWLLKFPIIGTAIAGGASAVAARGIYFESLLAVGVNPEFNNPGGMLCPVMDYGVAGGLTFWFFSGILLGRIYASFKEGTLGGILFYPVAVLSLMEVPRLVYWTEGRAFPTIFFLLATLFMVKDSKGRGANARATSWSPRPKTLATR